MVEAKGETRQRGAERTSGSKISGTRPSGLAAGYGFHPDTIASYQDTTTPNPSHDQPDLLSRYPWGFFSLIRKIADGRLGSLAGDNQTPAADRETQITAAQSKKTLRLEPHVDKLLTKALLAEESGQTEAARSLYIDAATGARAVYDTIPTEKMTESDGLSRAQHAEAAVIAFINAGEIDEARTLGEIVLADPLISQVHIARVRKAIELLGEAP